MRITIWQLDKNKKLGHMIKLVIVRLMKLVPYPKYDLEHSKNLP